MVVELTIFTQDNHTHVRQTSLDTDFRPPVWSGHELFPWTEHPCSTREGASCSTGGHTTVQNDMMPVLCFCLPERIIVCSWCLTSTRTFTPAAVKTSRISTHVGFSTACKKKQKKQTKTKNLDNLYTNVTWSVQQIGWSGNDLCYCYTVQHNKSVHNVYAYKPSVHVVYNRTHTRRSLNDYKYIYSFRDEVSHLFRRYSAPLG